MGDCKFTNAAQTCTSLSQCGRRFDVISARILEFLSLSIARSTWILQPAIFPVNMASDLVNWLLPRRNGGRFKKTFLGIRSWIMKPLSARIKSPAWKVSWIKIYINVVSMLKRTARSAARNQIINNIFECPLSISSSLYETFRRCLSYGIYCILYIISHWKTLMQN